MQERAGKACVKSREFHDMIVLDSIRPDNRSVHGSETQYYSDTISLSSETFPRSMIILQGR